MSTCVFLAGIVYLCVCRLGLVSMGLGVESGAGPYCHSCAR